MTRFGRLTALCHSCDMAGYRQPEPEAALADKDALQTQIADLTVLLTPGLVGWRARHADLVGSFFQKVSNC